jgi:hypothetical protein
MVQRIALTLPQDQKTVSTSQTAELKYKGAGV